MAIENVTPFAALVAAAFALLAGLVSQSKHTARLARIKSALGVLVLLAALMAPPAILAPVVAGSAGILMLASAGFPALAAQAVTLPAVPVQTTAIVRIVQPDPVRVFELENGAGVVVFREVNGKLVSRFYRDRKVA